MSPDPPFDFRNWMPARFYRGPSEWQVDWRHFGDLRFTQPFFDDTIRRALTHPFAAMFWRETPVEALLEWATRSPGLTPSGLVFHMSRCGSTLVSQMLAASPSNIVLSEPGPVDSILCSVFRGPVAPGERAEWLRAVVSAYGQRRFPRESRLFLKLDCWHIHDLPLFEEAFPGVPWVFLYRDPAEVLVSQFRQPGAWTLPGAIKPALCGIPLEELASVSREEYCARSLATILANALRFRDRTSGLFLNYRNLPAAVTRQILPHFGIAPGPPDASEEIGIMERTAAFNAKTPSLTYASDIEDKQRDVTPLIRQLTDQWLTPPYLELETRSAEYRG